jgi:hypothetical protein
MNVGQQTIAKIGLPAATFRLDRLEISIISKLVGDFVPLLRGEHSVSSQVCAAFGSALQSQDVVFDFHQRAIVRKLTLLQCDLILLQLRQGLVELGFLLDDLQGEVGVAELDQRLSCLDQVSGLDQHAFDASAVDSVEINRFARHDVRVHWDQITEHATLHCGDGQLLQRDPRCLATRLRDQLDRQQRHRNEYDRGERDSGSERPLRQQPCRAMNRTIHA